MAHPSSALRPRGGGSNAWGRWEQVETLVLDLEPLGSILALPCGGSLAQSLCAASLRASMPATFLSLGFLE